MRVTFPMRLAIAAVMWAAMVAVMLYSPPARAAGLPAGAKPCAVGATCAHDPGEWYVDANALFRFTVGEMHNAGKPKPDQAQLNKWRERCLWVVNEYNKRSGKIKVGGKSPVVKGQDADGPHNGMRVTEDFFEKRGLPRTLNGQECSLT